MKKLIAILIATAMACAFAPMVGADNLTAEIEVTLNPSPIVSIACDHSQWTPVCKLGETEQTATNWGNISNDGEVSVAVTIQAEGTEDWTIDTPGLDKFSVAYYVGSGWSGLSIEESFDSDIAPDAIVPFGINVTMPITSTTNADQHFTITFTASALA